MRIFVSWSGDRSRKIAPIVARWLKEVVPLDQNSTFISEDIQKGARWMDAVRQELSGASAAILCLTPDNLRSAWLHYEAGAIANAMARRPRRGRAPESPPLFPVLFGLRPRELEGPLGMFQATEANSEPDMLRLVEALAALKGPGRQDDPTRRFTRSWRRFRADLAAIADPSVLDLVPEFAKRFDRKTFNEPVHECTSQQWRARVEGAVETRAFIEADAARISGHLGAVDRELLAELLRQLDGYAMEMGALLLREERWGQDETGQIDLPGRVRDPCEHRRKTIRHLVQVIGDRDTRPLFSQSVRFEFESDSDQRKKLYIHPAEIAAQKLSAEDARLARGSRWDFDRIIFYLSSERADATEIEPSARVVELVDDAYREFEKLRSAGGGVSRMPLHYALRAALRCAERGGADFRIPASALLKTVEIRNYLDERLRMGGDDPVRLNLEKLQQFGERPPMDASD